MQTKLEKANTTKARLEISELVARIYAYTKSDAKVGTSNVVTHQLPFDNQYAYVLFDSRATHSFLFTHFAVCLNSRKDRIG